jgi:phosphonate transport system ATP-binding protein
MSAVFSLSEVTCRFGELAAVDGVRLEVEQGEGLAIIGPSGGGKTTLLQVLDTMRAPDEGSVAVLGNELADLGVGEMRRLRTRIAFIPQQLGLVPNLSVLQNVILGRGGTRGTLRSLRDLLLPAKADVLEIHRILERVGIEEKLYGRTDQLSGGQQQRVAIARALFQKPEVLLADEPVSSVDPARARDTVNLLCELSKEEKFTCCVSLHNLELAREFFPRIVGMRSGKIVFDDAPESLDAGEQAALFELKSEEMMIGA